MPDIERVLERAVEGLAALTQQVSRLAFAAERISMVGIHSAQTKTCSACLSRIQKYDTKKCLACGEFMGDG